MSLFAVNNQKPPKPWKIISYFGKTSEISGLNDMQKNYEILTETEAKQLVKQSYLLPGQNINNNKFYVTDLEYVYLVTKIRIGKNDNKVWSNAASCFVTVERVHGEVNIPTWIDFEIARCVLKNNLYVDSKNINDCNEGNKGSYVLGTRYSTCLRDILIYAKIYWEPLDNIIFHSNKQLVYDNGESIYTDKPIQLWSDGTLSKFDSSKSKKYGDLDYKNEMLIKYAVDSVNSKWRNNKRWQKLLTINVKTISEWQEIEVPSNTANRVIYKAALVDDKYILAERITVTFGIDADIDRDLILLDKDDFEFDTLKPKLLLSEKK